MAGQKTGQTKLEMTRRELLKIAGVGAVAVGLGTLTGVARAGENGKEKGGDKKEGEKKENVVAVGKAKDYPAGAMKDFPDQKIVVISTDDGLYAMSLVCTHKQGLTTFDKKKDAFVCPLHGAMFAKDGTVQQKPAKKDLPWYEVTLKDEELTVNLDKEVEKGTKLKLPAAKEEKPEDKTEKKPKPE